MWLLRKQQKDLKLIDWGGQLGLDLRWDLSRMAL